MKRKLTTIPIAITTAVVAAIIAIPNARANEITGSIGFGSLGVAINSSTLASASSFSLTSPFITTDLGDYTAVSILTPVTFSGFQFSPPVSSVTPLWTFTIGTTTYSFDATSVLSAYNSVLNEWDIGGSGIAMITGFDPTPGKWTVNLSQSGAAIVFDASSASIPRQSVPDSGSSLALLGGGLIGLAGLGRKLKP